MVEDALRGGLDRVAQDIGLGLFLAVARNLEALAKRAELAQACPTAGGLPLAAAARVFGAEPPAPVSNSPPPCISFTIESILAEVASSRIGKRSVR